MSQDQAVLLMSSYTADNIQEVNQRRVESSFEANKIDFISIDGALPENKDVRNILFGVSEQRGKVLLRPEELWNNSNNVVCCVLCVVCCVLCAGKYPQVFIKGADDSYKFVGLFEAFEGLLEVSECSIVVYFGEYYAYFLHLDV
jgi:hypothetical protein